MLNRIVLMSFKKDMSESQIDSIVKDLKEAVGAIPEVKSFSCGTDCSQEGLARELTHALVLSFDSLEARQNYFKHPEYKAIEGKLGAALESALTFDYVF
jgi:hypothetical protein